MNKINFTVLLALICTTILLIGLTSCKKCKPEKTTNTIEDNETLKRLYYLYRDGAIDECNLNGQIVYCGEYNNVSDGSKYVYEKGGKLIGACNYRSPMPDSICLQLNNCETIYRIKDNFWGLPEVDKYGLSK